MEVPASKNAFEQFSALVKKIAKGVTPKKRPPWLKIILFVLMFMVAVVYIHKYIKLNKPETMTNKGNQGIDQEEKFVVKEDDGIYDRFYCNIYDGLVRDKTKNRFEIDEIIKLANPKKTSKILDVGSGTGHHVKDLNRRGYDAVGLDKSPHMIAKARRNYPEYNYVNGDVLDFMMFPTNEFTHYLPLFHHLPHSR